MRIKYLNKGFLFVLMLLLVIVGCEDQDGLNDNLLVETNSIIFASSNRVIIQGSILSLKGQTVAQDYGFEISLNEDFDESRDVSLGERSGLGRFIVKINELQGNKQYFSRAYAVLDGERAVGQTLSFRTLQPRVQSFSPKLGDESENITIIGTNLPDSVQIFFGESRAQIESNLFNSKIVVRVPKFQGDIFVPIRFVLADTSFIVEEEFEYVTGTWGLTSTFPNDLSDDRTNKNYFEGLSIVEGTKIILGLGYDETRFSAEEVWTFDMSNSEWGSIFYPGQVTRYPFQFDNKFGGGRQQITFGVPSYNNEFWEVENGEFKFISTFPFDTYQTVGFELNDEYYVFGGVNELINLPPATPRNQKLQPIVPIYKFDGSNWNQLSSTITGPVSVEAELPNFKIDDIAYFIDREGSMYSFDESTFTWEFKSRYPGRLGYNGLSIVVAGKAYVGLLDGAREMFVYDPELNEWKRKRRFPARDYGQVVASGVYNDRVYVVRNPTMPDFDNFPIFRNMEVWVFDPVDL